MGKVTLDEKFKTYTGALPPKGHRFYLTNRYGQTIISHCPTNRPPETISDKQRASSSDLTQATFIADADLDDPVKHEQWFKRWREHSMSSPKPYKTLRGFTIAQVRKKLSNQQ